MSTPLAAIIGTRTKIRLGGAEVTVKPLSLRDIAELEGIYLQLFPGDTAESLSPNWNRKLVTSPEGAAAILRLIGRKDHPELETEPGLALALIDEASVFQCRDLVSAAFRDAPDPKATA